MISTFLGFIGMVAMLLSFIVLIIMEVRKINYNKKLRVKLKSNGMNFDDHIVNFDKLYNKFHTIKNSYLSSFRIQGIINDVSFTYYESLGNKHSIIIIDADDYEPNFSQIIIKKESWSKSKEDFDTEWPDFNTEFDNQFKNPRQALEIVTPTFMEKLFELSQKYNELKFEYFDDLDYQKHILALISSPAIFSKKQKNIDIDIVKLKELVKDLILLRENI